MRRSTWYACVYTICNNALTVVCSSAVPSTTVVTCRWHKESNSNSEIDVNSYIKLHYIFNVYSIVEMWMNIIVTMVHP